MYAKHFKVTVNRKREKSNLISLEHKDLWLNSGVLEEKQRPITFVATTRLMVESLIHHDILVIELMNPCWDSCGLRLRLPNHCWSPDPLV